MPYQFPAYQTRAEAFDALVARSVWRLRRKFPKELRSVQVGVEDVPPSDPAPWERAGVPMGRYFAADRPAGLRARIVIYRRPIETTAYDKADMVDLVWEVLVEQVSIMTGRSISDIDPNLD